MRVGLLALAAFALPGCDGPAEELAAGGPPVILQVRLLETVVGDARVRAVFGFGSHPLAGADDAHPVTTATATGNRLRVVIDELLPGEVLEEVGCRAPVDDDAFAPAPRGTTPDDVARCAVADAALADSCRGPRALCVCARDAGCPGEAGLTPRGASVGVLDADQDGAADAARLVAGAVALTCGGRAVPIDLDASYWTPSGSQAKGASFDTLGPAIVIVPAGSLPSGATCGLAFAPSVADRDGHALCAGAGCAAGDTGAIAFTVEPLALALTVPVRDPGQSRTAAIGIHASAALDPAVLGRISMTEAGAPFAGFTAHQVKPDELELRWPAGLAAATRYTIRIAAPTDTYGQAAPAFELAFTTGA